MKKKIVIEDDLVNIDGAKKVVSSTSNNAVVETENETIFLSGSEIEVKKLNLEEGEVVLQGKFTSLKFGVPSEKKSFLKKIFK